jgi:SAM-dependent methyltransferase
MNILNYMDQKGFLIDSERGFFQSAKGTRTITASAIEMKEVVNGAIERNRRLFSDSINDPEGFPVILPMHEETHAIVRHYKNQHASMFRQLRNAGIFHVPSKASILEVGFISGGHSIFGFEQLGFRAHGVDNHYGGVVGAGGLHVVNAGILGSEADFRFGDITGNAPFAADEMDIIYSASVLEHIQDLQKAFVEMHRILKPGGAMIHNYAPYFSHDGGHALCIPDSPWAHTRINESDYIRYLEEMRPLEKDISVDWYLKGLNRKMPLTEVQKWVVHAGFEIVLWMTKPSPQSHLCELTSDIIRESFAAFPHISLSDLVARSVSFVAIKK